MLTIETIKVNYIYFWEEHKETIEDILIRLFAPIWLIPVLLLAFIFYLLGVNSEDEEIDRKYCKEKGLVYPENALIPHQAVNKMRRAIKKEEAARKKELIRQRLREKQ
jgi:hypothetical protein